MYTPAFVEFLGTSLIVGTVAFTGTPLLVIAAIAIASSFGGKISGGHFNPARTVWELASGKIGQQKALLYIIAQIGAGLFIWLLNSFIVV